jgi:starch-binding outer membrane protein, SusD/RagB family
MVYQIFKTKSVQSLVISLGTAFCLTMMVSCDLTVLDPSTVEDADLDQPRAIGPILAGVEGDFTIATVSTGMPGGIFTAGSMITDELVHCGTWGPVQEWNEGGIDNGTAETMTRWSQGSRARWVAEDAIRRLSKIVDDPNSSTFVAQAAMWAGFANRVMGDHFCAAVVNEGPMEHYTVFHQRAEGYFTQAIEIATAAGEDHYRRAAYVGRAQTRMMLGNWDGAVQDAGQVPTNFVHVQRHSEADTREYNGLFVTHIQNNQTTVWGTPYAEWGTDTADRLDTEGDPRIVFESHATRLGGDNRRPRWIIQKYPSRSDDVAIAKGTEMRLIEAEAALIGNDYQTAIQKINEVRNFRGIDEVSAGDIPEAWYLLQKERGLELWLEGRRLPDMRRWSENPGTAPFEVVRQAAFGPASRDETQPVLDHPELCIPVSRNEILSNPNIDP